MSGTVRIPHNFICIRIKIVDAYFVFQRTKASFPCQSMSPIGRIKQIVPLTRTQVKTGEVSLNRDDYAQLAQKTFLFQSNERYLGTEAINVETISRVELLEFLQKSASWLPKSFKRKMEIVSQ